MLLKVIGGKILELPDCPNYREPEVKIMSIQESWQYLEIIRDGVSEKLLNRVSGYMLSDFARNGNIVTGKLTDLFIHLLGCVPVSIRCYKCEKCIKHKYSECQALKFQYVKFNSYKEFKAHDVLLL